MKIIAILSVAVLPAATAFAAPDAKVGDQAIYTGTMSIGQNAYPSTLTLEVTGPAAKPGAFVVKQTLSVASQSRETVSERTAAEIGDEAKTAEFVAKCEDNKGVREAITIESGETLQTCKVSAMQNGTVVAVNYAAVPFLAVRMVNTKTGQSSTLTLKSYRRGQ